MDETASTPGRSCPFATVERSLWSIMYRRIVVSMVLCGLVAAACVYAAAELLFTRIYASSREMSEHEAESKLALFDLVIERVERDSLANGRIALRKLGRDFPASTRLGSISDSSLKSQARELGVSEIYLIDSSGRVVATSFHTDRGLELFSLGADFAAFLRGLYGRGEIVDQRLSQSSLTGIINSYQYYSPEGSDFIIEISTRLSETIARSFPGLDYAGFVELAFGPAGGDNDRKPLARIVDLIAVRGISTWSLFQQKTEHSKYASLVEAAMRGEEAVSRRPSTTITVKPIDLSKWKIDFEGLTYYAVFELDIEPLSNFRLIALLSALAACGVAAGVSSVSMKRSFDRNVAWRIERLRADIGRAAEGSYGPPVDYGFDEIGAIAHSVDSMVKTILEKEERLRAAQRMETIGAMAGGLAHDFNNVLTGISGTLECMELRLDDGKASPEELLELTALASRTAKRGGEIVHDLLDIASIRPPDRRPIDLAAIAREAAELAGEGALDTVVVRVEAPDAPLIVRCDGPAVMRAVLNLCVNAVQAMTVMRGEGEKPGGLLLVRAEARPGSVPAEAAIVVKDGGVGIAPEDMGKVLMPFYSTKPRGLGTGMGLAIALSVAESHGGRLEMESVRGVGSTFALVLPV